MDLTAEGTRNQLQMMPDWMILTMISNVHRILTDIGFEVGHQNVQDIRDHLLHLMNLLAHTANVTEYMDDVVFTRK